VNAVPPTTAVAHPRPLVKICGLTRREDVALAAGLGAWAVGFVFAPSPRQVTIEGARALIAVLRSGAASSLAVGVFGDTSADTIAFAVDAAGLDAVQLHGAAPDARAVRRLLSGTRPEVLIVQAVPVAAEGVDVARLRAAVARAEEAADLVLFDTRAGGRSGGTGVRFPWHLAREAAGASPYLVAGGIGPEHAREALERSGAWGVDASSGVERAPGIKDEARLRALFVCVSDRAEGTTS
jgi:phosphoribosylanthranilate isomerase